MDQSGDFSDDVASNLVNTYEIFAMDLSKRNV